MKYETLEKNKGTVISEGDEYAMPNGADWETVPKKFHGQKLTSRRHSCDYRRPIPEKKAARKTDWKAVAKFCAKAAEYIEGSAKRRDKGHINNIRNLALEIEIKVAEGIAREKRSRK